MEVRVAPMEARVISATGSGGKVGKGSSGGHGGVPGALAIGDFAAGDFGVGEGDGVLVGEDGDLDFATGDFGVGFVVGEAGTGIGETGAAATGEAGTETEIGEFGMGTVAPARSGSAIGGA